MERTKAVAIDLVEAAYDLEVDGADWLPNLVRSGAEALDFGSGCAAAIWAGTSGSGEPLISQLYATSETGDLALRFAEAARELGAGAQGKPPTRTTGVHTLSQSRGRSQEVYEAFSQRVGCTDALALWAVDADLHGVGIHIPSSSQIHLSRRAREYWEMLVVHIAAGHRLRRSLGRAVESPGTPLSQIPLQAEAVLDPRRFSIAEATGPARDKTASALIREAAVEIDRARAGLRKQDPECALRVWAELVRGRWTLVDWFDSDGRRYVLARPNTGKASDPRGLTDREYQVAMYSAAGESNKLIGYRLGISAPSVSSLLRAAKRKLGVRTKPQLIAKMQALLQLPETSDPGRPRANAA